MIRTVRECDGFDVEPVVVLLLLRAVALIAVLFEDGAHVADKVHRGCVGGSREGEAGDPKEAHGANQYAHCRALSCEANGDIHSLHRVCPLLAAARIGLTG